MFSKYGKPEWVWQGINLCIFAILFWKFVLPERDNPPVFFGYLALWLVAEYLFFMIVHSSAGGGFPVQAEVPVKPTILVGIAVAILCALAAYFDITSP